MATLKRPLSVNLINQLNTPPETTIFQKVMIIFGAGVFVTLAALTACLPLNYVSHQPNSIPKSGPIVNDPSASWSNNGGDTAWMIIAASFAILASPVITFLYGNC
jgi:hypothetical protein